MRVGSSRKAKFLGPGKLGSQRAPAAQLTTKQNKTKKRQGSTETVRIKTPETQAVDVPECGAAATPYTRPQCLLCAGCFRPRTNVYLLSRETPGLAALEIPLGLRGTGTGGKKTLPPPVMLVAGCLGGTSI